MGSKGSQTSVQNTQSNQTYTPAGQNYLTGALGAATSLAGKPVPTLPTAPVADFSGQQQQAFGLAGNTGIQNPYLQQAQSYFSPQGAQQFYNPMADSVTAQLQNIFGQQNQQNNSNLIQSAGGVGADRIAVGQGNLANQQTLAAGQIYSGLYNQAAQQAQSAGYGTAGLGAQAQQANNTDIQNLLGSGGLQQQQQQAQLNAPYQQQLAQLALPYQLAQWYSGQVGSLAPALGGTSQGSQSGTTTSQYNPSLFSQITGGALGLGSIFGKGTGGAVPYARGGEVNPFAGGGAAPVDISEGMDLSGGLIKRKSFLPKELLPQTQAHVPQLNMSAPAPANMAGQQNQGMKDWQMLGKRLGGLGGDAWGGGSLFGGDAWGGSASNPIPGMTSADYGARGGVFARGGAPNPFALPHFDDGGGTGGDGGDGGGGTGSSPGSGDAGSSPGGGFGFGFDGDAAAAGLAGASGLGGLSDANSTSGPGLTSGNLGSIAGINLGNSEGFGSFADAEAAAAAEDTNATSEANPNTGVGYGSFPGSTMGNFASFSTPGSLGGPNGEAGFGNLGFGISGLGFGIPGIDGNNAVPSSLSLAATDDDTASPSVSLPGYGPPASPSLAALQGLSMPSLSPVAQNAQEAAQAAQAMADSIANPSPPSVTANINAALAALAGTQASPNAQIGEAAANIGLPGPAVSTAAATPAAPPSETSEPAPSINPMSFAEPSVSSPGSLGAPAPTSASSTPSSLGLHGDAGTAAVLRLLQRLAQQQGGGQTLAQGGTVNPFRMAEGGDLPGDAGDDAGSGDSGLLGKLATAYRRLEQMGIPGLPALPAEQPKQPLLAMTEPAGAPAPQAPTPAAPAVQPDMLTKSVAQLESSGRGLDGPRGRYSNELYQQFPAFVQQYGGGADGVSNYARQVLKAKPDATFGDFYGGYVTGTGNPAAASMGSLLTTTQPGAQGAFTNMMNRARRGEIPDPRTPLASLLGGGAPATAPAKDPTSPDAVLGRVANGLPAALPAAVTQGPPAAGPGSPDAQTRSLLARPAAPPEGQQPGPPMEIHPPPPTFPAIGAAAAQASPDSGGFSFPKLFNDQGGAFGSKGPVSGILDNPKRVALLMAAMGAWTPQGIAGGFQQGMQYMHGERNTDLTAKRLEQEANQHADDMKKTGWTFSKDGSMAPAPGGPADPDYLQKAAKARLKIPFGWEVTDEGAVQPRPGGPADPNYLHHKTEATTKESWAPAGWLQTADGALHPITQERGTGKLKDAVTGNAPAESDKITPKGAPKGASLSDFDAQAVARYVVATGDESAIRNATGMNAENKGLLQKHLQQERRDKGVDDAEYARRKQDFAANGISKNAAARTRSTREENLNMILDAAKAAIPAALEESEKVQRVFGSIVPLNRIIQKGELATSDENLIPFGMANLQLAEHWARAMNPTGVMRESDRDKALSFLDTGLSKGTYKTAVMQLQKQITRERDAIHQGRPGQGDSGVAVPGSIPGEHGAGAATPADGGAQRETKSINGKTYYKENGQWFEQ